MVAFFTFLLAYLLGGLTFVPLVLCTLFIHAYLTFPYVPPAASQPNAPSDSLRDSDDDGRNIRSGVDAADEKFHRNHEKEFGGYFAVCREWVPGGVNGKPPERTTPAGEVIAEESPSVYQSMYRSLFDRKQVPTMEVGKANSRSAKRARNVFYIVLRHGHLMLYDDSEQVEVRHVISLALHDVAAYNGGGEEIPEGELWIKRNAICLTRKTSPTAMSPSSKPFYLFSENCSDKEDFYFALLQNQERDGNDPHPPPLVQHFEVKHIISLVQRLHSSEEQLQTRWINAIIGRLFLGIYKTQEIEELVRTKITKKISRVKKPAFLSGIVLQKIDLGESAPFITNPRLKDLTVEGDCCVEADVRYEGNFRMEIAATAKIDLGTRFKAREVNLVLAIMMKRLDGHLLVRFKPPPSNRVWISFETMPQLEMNIEPIVSSRQITYSIILRAIESRIREVFAETLVLPHWDDSPFLSTLRHHFRGGIWVNERRDFQPPTETVVPDDDADDALIAEGEDSGGTSGVQSPVEDRSMSMPALADSTRPGLFSRKSQRSPQPLGDGEESAASTGVQRGPPETSKATRAKSLTLPAGPVVSTGSVKSEQGKTTNKKRRSQDAASLMSEISNRSQPGSPQITPAGSHDSRRSSTAEKDLQDFDVSTSYKSSKHDSTAPQTTSTSSFSAPSRASSASLGSKSLASGFDGSSHNPTRLSSVAKSLTPSEKKQQTLSAAAAAAKNWGWKTLTKSKTTNTTPVSEKVGTPDHPIGRGRPLPPPGQPLPPPEKRSSVPFSVLKRKAIPTAPTLPMRPPTDQAAPSRSNATPAVGFRPDPGTSTSNREKVIDGEGESESEGVLVVEAPADSPESETMPATTEDEDGYGEFLDNVNVEEEAGDDGEGEEEKEEEEGEEGEEGVEEEEEQDENSKDGEAPAPPLSPLPRPGSSSLTASYYDGINGLSSWQAAQESEARSKSVWMDEQEHP